MPYLLLVIGLIIGFYALYRFFINANTQQIKAFFAAALSVIIGIALLYLALTGKLIAALIGLVATAPALIGWIKKSRIKDIDPIDVEAEVEDITPKKDDADSD